jgi:hypothetical protein
MRWKPPVTVAALAIAAASACGKRAPELPADPAFEARWSALSQAGVLYVGGDESGAALEGNVRAARLRHPAPIAPGTGPAPEGALPDQPAGEALQQVIRSNLTSVKGCYATFARAGLGRSGKAIVSFTVGADGKAAGVQVDAPQFRGTALPGCLVATVSSWTFPKSQKGGGSVSYPFVFVGG